MPIDYSQGALEVRDRMRRGAEFVERIAAIGDTAAHVSVELDAPIVARYVVDGEPWAEVRTDRHGRPISLVVVLP